MKQKYPAVVPALVFVGVLIAHSSCPVIATNDSRWYVPVAMSMIKEGDTDLDEYEGMIGDNDYAIQNINGHLYNFFPIGVSVIAMPFVFVIDQVGSQLLSLDLDAYIRQSAPLDIELFIASFIIALTAVFIYFIARLFLAGKHSLLLVFVFAFCTSSWSTASRALWPHGPSMLMLTITLYLVLLARDKPRLVQFAGVPLACSYVMRPTNGASILLLTSFVLVEYKRYFLRYLLWAMTIAVPFLFYNVAVYHSVLPPYYLPQRIRPNPAFLEALAGNLISPARGLFIFTPMFLFSIGGIVLKIRNEQLHRLDCILLGIMFLHWISISSFPHWWAGWSFGPRLFSDMIPYFVYFLIPVVAEVPELEGTRKVILASALCSSVVVSFFVHYKGATDKNTFAWNFNPVSVDAKPSRLWDWSDIQFLRGIQVIEPGHLPLPRWSLWFVPNETEFTFGHMFDLKGYELRTGLHDYQVSLTLYWRALQQPDFDYSVFVHVIDDSNRLVAQKDHAPGASMGYPPTAWRAGDVIADKHVIEIPLQLAAGAYHFRVGVYNWATGERMQVCSEGEPAGDSVVLDQTLYRPPPLPPRSYLPFVLRNYP